MNITPDHKSISLFTIWICFQVEHVIRDYNVTRFQSFFFFFQAEDGIRDYKVTGVQTCALPIFDAACASSLVAVDLGMRDLLSGRCDLAVVGGVHASTPPPIVMIFCQLKAISKQIGRASCRERV